MMENTLTLGLFSAAAFALIAALLASTRQKVRVRVTAQSKRGARK